MYIKQQQRNTTSIQYIFGAVNSMYIYTCIYKYIELESMNPENYKTRTKTKTRERECKNRNEYCTVHEPHKEQSEMETKLESKE